MTEPSRRRLPNRRVSITQTLALPGWPPIVVTVGLDAAARVLEVFVRAQRPASDLDRLLDDGAVIASLAMQHGATAGELAASIARRGGEPSTVLGAALDFAAEIDAAPGA